jgi:hypothetical protein
MAVGLLVGFFICRMLLERTIKVFSKKNWLQLVAFCLVVAFSFGLTAFDVFGVTSHIPDTKNVKSVTIADTYLSEYRLDDLSLEQPQQEAALVPVMVDPYYSYSKEGMMTLTKADDIETIRQIHQLLIDEGDAFENGTQNYLTVTLHYVLKNGSTITRYYRTARNSPAMEKMVQYTSSPQFILGYSTPEEMVKYLMREFEDDPKAIWQSNMFGKSLYELVGDGLTTKLDRMPEDARQKFGETLSKIINEGSQGLICIIL